MDWIVLFVLRRCSQVYQAEHDTRWTFPSGVTEGKEMPFLKWPWAAELGKTPNRGLGQLWPVIRGQGS